MHRHDRIFVAGHRGLVGSALVRRLRSDGYSNLITRTHEELDLGDAAGVRRFFEAERPQFVFLAAARVGGILANASSPADFIRENLAIQVSVLHEAYRARVAKLLFLGSSCIYPRLAPQPIREEHLLTGPLEPTNEAYAVAKIAGVKMCAAYNRQYATNFIAVMPTNLYGPGDNYDPETSHVLPAMIHKMHAAKLARAPQVQLWGTGQPRRELLFSDDLADACVFLMQRHDARDIGEIVNIGVGQDVTVRELAMLVQRTVGYEGDILFDPSKPDGTPRKLLDVSRLTALGWQARTPLEHGIRQAYEDYLGRLPAAGGTDRRPTWRQR